MKHFATAPFVIFASLFASVQQAAGSAIRPVIARIELRPDSKALFERRLSAEQVGKQVQQLDAGHILVRLPKGSPLSNISVMDDGGQATSSAPQTPSPQTKRNHHTRNAVIFAVVLAVGFLFFLAAAK